ncbi:MAG TPA: membrane dipeptidase [Chitinophagaceae bacterium]|jgi:microsomal dipeptidase-like Zn-dependent dipeptidase|nr:membrane dipeptidase [Chitinophagaceae bacterium]
MNYFDFHIHPTLKSTLKAGTPYDVKIPTQAVSGVIGMCTDLPQIVASQANVGQLQRFDQTLLGVALYSMESVIAGDRLLNEVARKNKKLSKYVGVQRLEEIRDNRLKAYDYIRNVLLPDYEEKPEFKIVDRDTDLSNLDPNKIHVFFVLEGAHSLCNSSNTDFNAPEIIENLRDLSARVPLLSINPTHMQQSDICNHAYGIQLTNNAAFIPSGNGLTIEGKAVVQACFDLNICIDVKHMSLVARRQLFQQVQDGTYRNPQPVICTHAGFTGVPSADIHHYVIAFEQKGTAVKVVYGKPNHIAPNVEHRQRPAPTFNMSSINLYDEEIVAIVRNGGLIGLSMDRRICGFVSQFDEDPFAFVDGETYLVDKEFFSVAEFQQLGIHAGNIRGRVNDAHCNLKSDLLEVSELPSMLEEFHRQQLMLQLKHYLQVCVGNGIELEEAQSRICIGSDFDGIINPFYCAMTVEDLEKFRKYLIKHFRDFLGRYADSRAWRDRLDLNRFAEQLFFRNGRDFVQQRLTALQATRASVAAPVA